MENIKCPHCGEMFTIDESGYAAIVSQIKDKEFDKLVEKNKKELEEKQKSLIDNAVLVSKSEADKRISELESKIEQLEYKNKVDIENKNKEIESLKEEKNRAVLDAVRNEKDKLKEVETELKDLKKDSARAVEDAVRTEKERVKDLENQIKENQLTYSLELKNKDELHEKEIRYKDEEIARVKEFKLQQSTKMIGESLEKFCEDEFNKLRAAAFQSAYFEKDNDARTGSKGDYIFRDSMDGVDYISIMFEMKNENDETKTKHKNEDFFKELDKDRKEKNCEYAVLVSMLESDNEYYNTGIVDVSHKYPKMYVVRPQFFIPIITLLRNAAMNNWEDKKALVEMQNKNIDVSNFESSLLEFKEKFGRNYELANKKFNNAIEEIDKTITHLQKVKDELLASDNNLRLANNKLDDLTIKKLTKNNSTMQKMFTDAGVDIKKS